MQRFHGAVVQSFKMPSQVKILNTYLQHIVRFSFQNRTQAAQSPSSKSGGFTGFDNLNIPLKGTDLK